MINTGFKYLKHIQLKFVCFNVEPLLIGFESMFVLIKLIKTKKMII